MAAVAAPAAASGIVSRIRGRRAALEAARAPLDLSIGARLYLGAVITAAIAACGQSYFRLPAHVHGWEAFAALTVLATLAQVYVVEGRNNQSYRTSIAFLLAASVVLAPAFIAPLVVLHYIPSWIKDRTRALVQSFNIANTALAMVAAGAAFHTLSGADVAHEPVGQYALAGLVACAAFVLVNHVLLARMIQLATSRTMRQTGLFSFESLSTDLGLAALGVGVAAFWSVNGWLIFFVLGPLLDHAPGAVTCRSCVSSRTPT